MSNPRFIYFLSFIFLSLVVSCKPSSEKSKEETKVIVNVEDTAFEAIFDGKTLENWQGDDAYWRVENGVLVGEVTIDKPLINNTFLIFKDRELSDFELKLDFKIETAGNSGINYRSEEVDSIPYALRGYQADIDGKKKYTGQNYEERKRTTLAYRGENTIVEAQPNYTSTSSLGDNIKNNAWQSRNIVSSLGDEELLRDKINSEEWNSCHLIIKGNRLQHYINGILMSEVEDQDSINFRKMGLLGLQLHVGPPMKVFYKNIRLKNL
ncbi:MAG: DUF1080 domain-containing protein [Eudoraea sp.]|uniref:3-keto-disaccharide hydrolase n=1 Tax=Eudoraea sp. TaxID=1979955 RepID=UPI003C715718